MNDPWRTTVAPSTPRTAAANGRMANRRGSTAGSVGGKLEPDEQESERDDGEPPPVPSPPSPRRAADRGEQRDEHHRQEGQAGHVDRPAAAGGEVRAASAGHGRHPVRPDDQPDREGGEQRDRHREKNSDRQPKRADEQAADERADRRAGRDEHVEQAESRAPAVGRRDGPDQRDRGGRDQRSAERLEDP